MKRYITTALVFTAAIVTLPGCFWPFKRKKAEEPKKEVAAEVVAQNEAVKF